LEVCSFVTFNVEFESVVAKLEADIVLKDAQLEETLSQIKTISKELANSRRVIQQLSVKVAELEQKKTFYEQRIGVKGAKELETDTEKLQKEVLRLHALLKSHNISTEEYELPESSAPMEIKPIEEPKVNQLLNTVLGDNAASNLGDNLVDSLMTAVASEKQPLTDPDMTQRVTQFMSTVDSKKDEMEGIQY
jgi:hypothetical protein